MFDKKNWDYKKTNIFSGRLVFTFHVPLQHIMNPYSKFKISSDYTKHFENVL